MHNATVQQPLTMVSPNSNPTIVMLQAEARFVSKHSVVPFHCPYTPFIVPFTAQTPMVSRQRQWCNEVGVIVSVSPSFLPPSSDDRPASKSIVSSNTLTDFYEG
ncbi:hypothetical protein TNCV_2994641 [Trichonephila clavipes]|nr:hypothetical protein TNCV_2994641 [Trichonephila clavipes]